MSHSQLVGSAIGLLLSHVWGDTKNVVSQSLTCYYSHNMFLSSNTQGSNFNAISYRGFVIIYFLEMAIVW